MTTRGFRTLTALTLALAACATDAPAPFSDHGEASDYDPVDDGGKADGVPATFDKNHVIDDAMLVGSTAMDVAGVQAFLEHDPYGSRSWLADATVNGAPASQAIVDAATAQNIDPLALIVRMQVEASLVSQTSQPSAHLINQALGCGCPDGGSCSTSYKGLGPQLTCGAQIFRRWYDASANGTGEFIKGHTGHTLDPASVKPVNDATASLYAYTPWVVSNNLVWNVFRKYLAHARSLGVFHDVGAGSGTGTGTGTGTGAGGPAWAPHAHTSWQIQLGTAAIDTSFDVAVYDVDLFDTPQATIDSLHAAGRKVICYFSAGSHEDWRPDASQFPAAAIGSPLDGWPGEHWLDTRSAAVRTIMQARLDRAAAAHCDGVDPDNVDGYTNNPGFALTAATQLDFNRFLATEAHARGMAVGLKNDMDQIGDLVSAFDWTVNEQCFQYDECDTLTPFITANKPVFQLEYGSQARATAVCASANARNFDTLVKNLDLDAPRISCR